MAIVKATYETVYDDYNGGDRVPCLVDDEAMEVIEFFPATACRWDDPAMCTEEWICFEDGREFEAIKFDEYNDAVHFGYEDDYDRDNIVLFDSDALEAAMP